MLDVFKESPHRRWNPLRREWVIVSPHRTQRPWQGQTEEIAATAAKSYDPECYLCPGNMRAGGHRNPVYSETYVFENDFAALKSTFLQGSSTLRVLASCALRRSVAFAECSVLIRVTISHSQRWTAEAIRRVVDVWAAQELELGAREDIRYVQIFENRGAMMGASNPHPHGQIWATEHIPNEPAAESASQSEYLAERGRLAARLP